MLSWTSYQGQMGTSSNSMVSSPSLFSLGVEAGPVSYLPSFLTLWKQLGSWPSWDIASFQAFRSTRPFHQKLGALQRALVWFRLPSCHLFHAGCQELKAVCSGCIGVGRTVTNSVLHFFHGSLETIELWIRRKEGKMGKVLESRIP